MSTCNTCDVELMRIPLEYQNEMFLKRRPALSVESRVKAQTEVFMPMVSGASLVISSWVSSEKLISHTQALEATALTISTLVVGTPRLLFWTNGLLSSAAHL